MNNISEKEFDELQFEKKLTQLKNSQESINTCCQWCLANRIHNKKIVTSWLNVLKRVKVEHRLTLFYLANDVIQYSKRKRYEFVESWATALQKATTMVRDDRIKNKILRIFKIWEDRSIYSEEFISDLCGLISVTPTAPKNEEPHEFQPSYVIHKIKALTKTETDAEQKLKKVNVKTPKIVKNDSITSTLKDRAHLDDTEKELDHYVKNMEDYINALKAEIKSRITLITVLKQAEGQLETDKKDVKVVANAYKSFGQRVKTLKKKLEEHMLTLTSPIPSPDINAPSPNSDSDIDLPDDNVTPSKSFVTDPISQPLQITNANFYTPVPPPATDPSAFSANGFTSFLGSNISFADFNFSSTSLYSNAETTSNFTNTTNSTFNSLSSILPNLAMSKPPPPPASVEKPFQPDQTPLLPPPLPLFDSKESYPAGMNYNASYDNTTPTEYGSFTDNPFKTYNQNQPDAYDPSSIYSNENDYEVPQGSNPYPPAGSEEYNPEQELETWETDNSWPQLPLEMDTPESPPPFEKEPYDDNPIEYHDSVPVGNLSDVDHRILPMGKTDKVNGRTKDVDHRNLISLIGSPVNDSNSNSMISQEVWNGNDQDFRNAADPANKDHDFRLPFSIDQMKLPPPPPPPTQSAPTIQILSNVSVLPPKKPTYSDNVESIDMELSDEDESSGVGHRRKNNADGAYSKNDYNEGNAFMNFGQSLEPPPPLPDFPDDCEENILLDDLANDINLNEFLLNATVPETEERNQGGGNMWNNYPSQNTMMPNMNQMPPPPPLLPIPNNWMPPQNSNVQDHGNFQYRGRGNNFRNPRGFYPNNKNRGRGGMMPGGRGGRNMRGPRGGQRFRGNFRGNFRGGF